MINKDFFKQDLGNLMDQWFEFRDEKFEQLSKEDRKHLLKLDDKINYILSAVPKTEYSKVFNILDELGDKYLEFCSYYNQKYYMSGFYDGINILILALSGGVKNEIR